MDRRTISKNNKSAEKVNKQVMAMYGPSAVSVKVRMSYGLVHELDDVAVSAGMTRSEAVRYILRLYAMSRKKNS